MPRPVGEKGPTGASVKAHTEGKRAPRNPSANTPKAAVEHPAAFAEANVSEETLPGGGRRYGPTAYHDALTTLHTNRKKAARQYERYAIHHIEVQNLKFDDNGKVITEPVKRKELTPQGRKNAEAELHQAKHYLNTLIRKGRIKSEKQYNAIGKKAENKIVSRNEVERTVQRPHLKYGEEAVNMSLKHVGKVAKEIEEGKQKFTMPEIEAKPEPKPEDDGGSFFGDALGAVGNVLGAAPGPEGAIIKGVLGTSDESLNAGQDIANKVEGGIGTGAGAVDHAVRQWFRTVSGAEQGGTNMAGIGLPSPTAIANSRNLGLGKVKTGLIAGAKLFQRPVAITESLVGHALAGENQGPGGGLLSWLGSATLSDADKRKLRHSASVLEAIEHGYNTNKKPITGATLSETLLNYKHGGLLFDLGLDPTLYIGIGAVREAAGREAIQIESRLAEDAPGALKGSKYAILRDQALRSGDFTTLRDFLRSVAKEHKVSLRKLGTRPAEKKAVQELLDRNSTFTKEIAESIQRGLDEGSSVAGRSMGISGDAVMEAAEQVARQAAERGRAPGVSLNFMTPFGHRLTGIDFKMPKRISENYGFITPARNRHGIETLAKRKEVEIATADVRKEALPEIAELRETLATAQREHKLDNTKEIQHKLDSRIEDLKFAELKAAEQTGKNTTFTSFAERSKAKNRRRFAHEIQRVSNAVGRTIQRKLFHTVATVLDPLRNDRLARERIGAIMAFDADTGAIHDLLDVVGKDLSPSEVEIIQKLNEFYRTLGDYGLATGSLKRTINEKYFPRQYTDAPDRGKSIKTGIASERQMERSGGGYQGREMTAAQGRGLSEAAQIMDRNRLAYELSDLFKIGDTEAKALADHWHDASIKNFAIENLAHQTLRDYQIPEESLSKIEKTALAEQPNWQSGGKPVERIFQDLGDLKSEGILKLHEASIGQNGNFDKAEQLLQGSLENEHLVKLSSALESKNKIEALLERVKNRNPDLQEHYETMLKRTDDEIKQLKAAKAGPEERILPPAVTNQKEDLTKWVKKKGEKNVMETPAGRIEKGGKYYHLSFKKDGEWAAYGKFTKRREAMEAYDAHLADPENGFKNYMDLAEQEKVTGAGARNAELVEGDLKVAIEDAEKARSEIGATHHYGVKIVDKKGKTIKRLPNRFDTTAEAEAFGKQLHDSGQLPPGTKVDGFRVKNAESAAQADRYKEEATKVNDLETELEAVKANATKKTTGSVRTRQDIPEPVDEQAYGFAQPKIEEPAKPSELHEFIPNATEEYIGGLRDYRKDHENWMLILDPMASNYHRIRSESLQTVFRSRWRAVDTRVGRSTAEAQGGRYTAADGATGYTADLKADYGEFVEGEGRVPTEPIAYVRRDDPSVSYKAEEISFDEKSMVPIGERYYDTTTGREYVPVREYDPQGVGGLMAEVLGHDRVWPHDELNAIKEEFLRMGEGSVIKMYESGIEDLLETTMTLARFGLTTYFPAYHVRNMISDVMNSLLADTGMIMHPISNAKMTYEALVRGGKTKDGEWVTLADGQTKFNVKRRTISMPGMKDVEISTEGYLMMMDLFGLRSNLHIAELTQLAEKGEVQELDKWLSKNFPKRLFQSGKRGFGIGPSGAVGRKALEASARREDIVRILTFTQRMRRNGGDVADAAWWTIKHHFDYGDLTPFERRWMRTLFLFYTWYRKNIPLQFMSMITRPGFFSGLTSIYKDTAEGTAPWNQDWSKIQPWLPNLSGPVPNSGLIPPYYLTQLGAVTTSWNHHAAAFGFGAPFADTNLVTRLFENPEEGVRQVLNLTNPILTTAVQVGTRTNLLTGDTFNNKETGGAANLLESLGLPVGHDSEGNAVLPWAATILLGNVPVFGRGSGYFRSPSTSEDPGFLSKTLGGGIGSALTGLTIYVSPKDGERLDSAYLGLVLGRAAQRKDLIELGGSDHEVAVFDRETKTTWAKQLMVPDKYLHVIKGLGPDLYISKEDRKVPKIASGGGVFGGGSSGGSLKGIAGILGSDNTAIGHLNVEEEPKEYPGGEREEALDKLNGRGGGNIEKLSNPLGEGFLSGGSAPDATIAVEATPQKLNTLESRTKLNAQARRDNKPFVEVPNRQEKPGKVAHPFGFVPTVQPPKPKGKAMGAVLQGGRIVDEVPLPPAKVVAGYIKRQHEAVARGSSAESIAIGEEFENKYKMPTWDFNNQGEPFHVARNGQLEYSKEIQELENINPDGTPKSTQPTKGAELNTNAARAATAAIKVPDIQGGINTGNPATDILGTTKHPTQAPKHNTNKKVANQLSEYGLDPKKVGFIQAAAKKYGVAPELIAAIGKVESGNGTSTLPGVSSGQNSAGAAGPFQIGNGTGAAGNWWGENMPAGANPYDYKTASLAAAKYLHDAGATTDPSTWHDAALSYNHAEWYAQEVVKLAQGAAKAPWQGAAAGGGPELMTVRQTAKKVIQTMKHVLLTPEGSKLQSRWAAESGISSATAWCSAFTAAMMRKVGLPEPDNPAAAGTWDSNWKGGKNIGTDLSKARPGDIIVIGASEPVGGGYADHVGIYVGNGEMIAGNSSNEVAQSRVADDSRGIQQIVRPNYSGKKTKVAIPTGSPPVGGPSSATTSSGGVTSGGGATEGYHPGVAGIENKELKELLPAFKKGTAGASGGSSSGSSISSLNTTSEAFGIGSHGASGPAAAIIARAKKELEALETSRDGGRHKKVRLPSRSAKIV